MADAEHLSSKIGAELNAAGGVLDKLDYNRLRHLGVTLRNIPRVRKDHDWDLPPAVLQGWIKSYSATLDTIRMAEEAGLTSVLQENSAEIRALLSPEVIPLLDRYVISKEDFEKELEELISLAKASDAVRLSLPHYVTSDEELAHILVVDLYSSVQFRDRPIVDKKVGMKRLQIGALIGKVAVGGALTVANLSIGALAGVVTALPTLSLGSVAAALGIATSCYTGLVAASDAVEKIAGAIRE